jgi:hypothetical protein
LNSQLTVASPMVGPTIHRSILQLQHYVCNVCMYALCMLLKRLSLFPQLPLECFNTGQNFRCHFKKQFLLDFSCPACKKFKTRFFNWPNGTIEHWTSPNTCGGLLSGGFSTINTVWSKCQHLCVNILIVGNLDVEIKIARLFLLQHTKHKL